MTCEDGPAYYLNSSVTACLCAVWYGDSPVVPFLFLEFLEFDGCIILNFTRFCYGQYPPFIFLPSQNNSAQGQKVMAFYDYKGISEGRKKHFNIILVSHI